MSYIIEYLGAGFCILFRYFWLLSTSCTEFIFGSELPNDLFLTPLMRGYSVERVYKKTYICNIHVYRFFPIFTKFWKSRKLQPGEFNLDVLHTISIALNLKMSVYPKYKIENTYRDHQKVFNRYKYTLK